MKSKTPKKEFELLETQVNQAEIHFTSGRILDINECKISYNDHGMFIFGKNEKRGFFIPYGSIEFATGIEEKTKEHEPNLWGQNYGKMDRFARNIK